MGESHEIIVNMFAYIDDNHDRDNPNVLPLIFDIM
jgi:hypothetical protein